MNTKTRYLVLNAKNEVQKPYDAGYDGSTASLQKPKSPSFLDEGEAKGFAEFLAEGETGANFYVAQVIAVATLPEGVVVQATAPGTWTAAPEADADQALA